MSPSSPTRRKRAARGPEPAPRRGPKGPSPAPTTAKGAPSPQQQAYATERTAVVKLHMALAKHPQAAHVKKDKIEPSAAALGAANAEAAKPDWPKAMAKLAESRKACTEGKEFADKYAAFMVKRGQAGLLLAAAQTNKMKTLAAYPPRLASADKKVLPDDPQIRRRRGGLRLHPQRPETAVQEDLRRRHEAEGPGPEDARRDGEIRADRDRRDRGDDGAAGGGHRRQDAGAR